MLRVQRCQFARKDAQRPAVRDNVVHDEQQALVRIARTQYVHPHKRILCEIKRRLREFFEFLLHCFRTCSKHVDDVDRDAKVLHG